MWLVLSVVATVVGVVILGTLVLLRGVRTALHVNFAVFAYVTGLWTLANFIDTNYKTLSIAPLAAYVDFILGCFVGYAIWAFASVLLEQADTSLKYRWLYGRYIKITVGVLTTLAALSVFVPSVLQIEQLPGKALTITYGPGYALYSGLLLVLAPLIITTTFFARRRAQGRLKEQISIILAALVVTVILLALADLVLPNLSTSAVINMISGDLAYLGIAFIVAGTFYSIVKRRLFDMRLALARTFGFVATIGVLSAVYSLLVLGVGALLVTHGQAAFAASGQLLLIFLPATLLIGLTFHSVERFIARHTRHLFYQDFYDTRQTLDMLSSALISDNDLGTILSRGLNVLVDAIRPVNALMVVLDAEGNMYRHVALNYKRSLPDLPVLSAEARASRHQMLVKDETPAAQWPKAYEQSDIALSLRLGTGKAMAGVLFLGPKQNGRIYTQRDVELLNVGIKNFSIAIENAKKYEQIAAFADTLKVEVARATASLRRANSKLLTLDAMKDDFLSMASHQLRSPATSVRDAIQMLGHTYLTPAERKKIIALAEASSERLVNVVTDMLSVARIQAGHFTIDKTDVDMIELVRRSVEQVESLAQAKNLKITTQYPDQPVHVKADRAKIIEIIANYLENAIRYSDDHSEIFVALKREGGRVLFEVRDHGIGVPAGERKHLFERFFRASNARKDQPNGNGIGLFVVKTVAEAHGGAAYYKPESSGSLFGFWLKS